MQVPCPSPFNDSLFTKTNQALNSLKISCINAGLSRKNLEQTLAGNQINQKNVNQSYYYQSLMQEFQKTNLNFSENYQHYFSYLIVQYLLNYFQNNQDYLFYNLLIQIFLYSSKVYDMYTQTNGVLCGIYLIINVKTHKAYIGQSWNILTRFESHKEALIENSHHNQALQEAFNVEL